MDIFSKDGRLLIPLNRRKELKNKVEEDKVRYVVKEAFCPNGCSIIDAENSINGHPGIRFRFKRADTEGEFVISAIEGDFDKILLSGTLKNGVKDELYCPHCNTQFEKLVNCDCKPEANMVCVGLTPSLDYNNAITFCNVTGCANGNFISSGEIIKHIRLSRTH